MLHSHPFGLIIENEFAGRNICRSSQFEEYMSEYSQNMNAGALNMSICKETQF